MLPEDNLVNIRIIIKLMDRYGYALDIAHNGQEAVDKVFQASETSQPYDLILMDVQMPVMSGHDAAKRIRLASNLKRQPIIVALTANAMLEDKEACLACGMNLFLAKPLKPTALADILEKSGEMVRLQNETFANA